MQLFDTENNAAIQGIENYSEMVFIAVGKSNKILVGSNCKYRAEYEKKAREVLPLLSKY